MSTGAWRANHSLIGPICHCDAHYFIPEQHGVSREHVQFAAIDTKAAEKTAQVESSSTIAKKPIKEEKDKIQFEYLI